MSDSQKTQTNTRNLLLTLLGGLGAILIFGLILFIAYLPNRPAPVDEETNIKRQIAADEARAEGVAKLGNIEEAMQVTVSSYLKD
jgi:hypothetical protein